MKMDFYLKLAVEGMLKNKKMYIPYILTCIAMFMMCYIIYFLKTSDVVLKAAGTVDIVIIIEFGIWMVVIFVGIFLIYADSFLIRRRKKEFGLYNILGMDKKNISKLLFFEILIILLITIILGFFGGILLSKTAELLLVHILNGEVDYNIGISIKAFFRISIIFCVIFLIVFLNSMRQINFSTAISLLKSENFGEKSLKKCNWIFGILGFLLLILAYYIAINESGSWVMVWFLVAALLVVVGTYGAMTSGSIILCGLLKKNKNYYYKPRHFISLSSMIYRMKRNGIGLASMCVLSTIVLVVVSTFLSSYFGVNAKFDNEFVRDTQFVVSKRDFEQIDGDFDLDILDDSYTLGLKKTISGCANDKYNIDIKDFIEYRQLSVLCKCVFDNKVNIDEKVENEFVYSDYSEHVSFLFIPIQDYNKNMNVDEKLSPGEVMIDDHLRRYNADSISFYGKNQPEKSFKIVKKDEENMKISGLTYLYQSSIIIYVSGIEEIKEISNMFLSSDSLKNDVKIESNLAFNVDYDSEEELNNFIFESSQKLRDIFKNNDKKIFFNLSNLKSMRDLPMKIMGGVWFIGIFLSVMFVWTLFLIMYYKQLSEGYEDAKKFEIMKKIGITGKEIKQGINSQLPIVFLLPLLGAGVHLAFSSHIMVKIFKLAQIYYGSHLILITLVTYLLFDLLYFVIYKITSTVYYKIVSGAEKDWEF